MSTNQTVVTQILTSDNMPVNVVVSNLALAEKIVGSAGMVRDYPNLAFIFEECGLLENEAFIFSSVTLKNNLEANGLYEDYLKATSETVFKMHDGNRQYIAGDPDWVFYNAVDKCDCLSTAIATIGKDKLIAVTSVLMRTLIVKVMDGNSDQMIEQAAELACDSVAKEVMAIE